MRTAFARLFQPGPARLLRRLVRAEERQAAAAEQGVTLLTVIGRMIAAATHQPWPTVVRPADANPADPTPDEASIGAPDDAFFADVEAIEDDYLERFGREITPEEVLAVYQDHQTSQRDAREAHGDHPGGLE